MKTEKELIDKLMELYEKLKDMKLCKTPTKEFIIHLACTTGQIEAILWVLGRHE